MGEILVGTASWADKSLLDSGLFYPKQAKTAEARLRYYSTQFRWSRSTARTTPCRPRKSLSCGLERTPETFVFDVKAFRIFTQHQTPPNVLPKDIREALAPLAEKKNVYYADFPPEVMEEMWRRFRLALEPLRHAGKLGAVLFQFPPWFYYRRSNLGAHRAVCADPGRLSACRRVPEPNLVRGQAPETKFWPSNGSKADPRGGGRAAGIFKQHPRDLGSNQSGLAIFRLHGRNAKTWDKKGLTASSERFDYEYRETELREFIPPVVRLAQQAERVHVRVQQQPQGSGDTRGQDL